MKLEELQESDISKAEQLDYFVSYYYHKSMKLEAVLVRHFKVSKQELTNHLVD